MSAYEWTAAIVCMTGTVLNVRRVNLCFALWAVGEAMWACWDWRAGAVSRLLLDLMGLALAFAGAWRNGLGIAPKGAVK